MLRLRTKSKRVLLHSWTRHYKNILGAGKDYNSKKYRDKGIKSTIAFLIFRDSGFMKPGVLFEKNYFLISDWNALISFATSPLKSNRQIRFGIAIRAFAISEKFQTRLKVWVHPKYTMSEKRMR